MDRIAAGFLAAMAVALAFSLSRNWWFLLVAFLCLIGALVRLLYNGLR